MRKFYEILYFKYYWFQVRVGNEDVAVLTAFLIIIFLHIMCLFGVLLILSFIFNYLGFSITFSNLFYFLIIGILIILMYFLLISKKKYRYILSDKKIQDYKYGNIVSLLFPVFSFLLLMIGFILKILQNNGLI